MSEEIEFNRLTSSDDNKNETNDVAFGSTDETNVAKGAEEESSMKLLQDLTSKQNID